MTPTEPTPAALTPAAPASAAVLVAAGPASDAPRDSASARPQVRLARQDIRLEGGVLELTTDPERTASLVSSIYHLLGRPGLWMVSEQLRALTSTPVQLRSARLPITRARITGMGTAEAIRSDAVAVADLWENECSALDSVIARWLIEVEDRATIIALARLRASRGDVLAERARYFEGLGPAGVDDRRLRLRGGQLSARAEGLRTFLHDVAALRLRAQEDLAEFHRIVEPHIDRPAPEKIDAARRAVLEQVAVLLRRIDEEARASPLLYWIVDWEAAPIIDLELKGGNDAVLSHRIAVALSRCWHASWTVQDRISAMPARTTTAVGGDGTPEERIGNTVLHEDEAGPWRFPAVLEQALDELGWPAPSPQAVAVARTMAEAGSTWNQSIVFAAASFAFSVAVHLLLPPAAIAADLAIATVNLAATKAQLAEQQVEFIAILDQRQALTTAPTGREVGAALTGVVIAPYEGVAALLANLLPIAVQVWTTPAVENTP